MAGPFRFHGWEGECAGAPSGAGSGDLASWPGAAAASGVPGGRTSRSGPGACGDSSPAQMHAVIAFAGRASPGRAGIRLDQAARGHVSRCRDGSRGPATARQRQRTQVLESKGRGNWHATCDAIRINAGAVRRHPSPEPVGGVHRHDRTPHGMGGDRRARCGRRSGVRDGRSGQPVQTRRADP